MHSEPVNENDLLPTATELLDQRIVRALEVAPQPRIPADFAARVASQLPARRPVSLTPTHYGHKAVLIAMVVTLVAVITLALRAAAGPANPGLVESLLCTEFIALAVWFGIARPSLR
jgi:hypothetical protein